MLICFYCLIIMIELCVKDAKVVVRRSVVRSCEAAGSLIEKFMARGWESKSVESQMETSQSKKEETARKRVSLEVAAATRKKETLMLARAHLQQQMQL